MHSRRLGTVLTLALGLTGLAQAALGADEDLIPPEVLKQMDPDILAAKRPVTAKVGQGDIYDLRDRPRKNADFVSFAFDYSKLTSVQRKIMENWARGGHNNILLQDEQIENYAPLLGQRAGALKSSVGLKTEELAETAPHPVNTDCVDVVLLSLPNYYFEGLPTNHVAVIERGSRAFAGSFPLDETTVYFLNTPAGSDARRWQLNFWHWALGLPVPGAAETGVSQAEGLSLREAERHDSVSLTNGDILYGSLGNETLTIQTSYGDLTFKVGEIDRLIVGSRQPSVDILILKQGDRLSGSLKEELIQFTLVNETEMKIPKADLKSIRTARTD